jgi:hypothetical protein
MPSPRFRILTWHSVSVTENTYNGNDQMAFAADLRTLHRCGARIWPLADALAALDADTLPENVVVLTADDGSILDFLPFEHPGCGHQPGLYRLLCDFAKDAGSGAGHRPHLSSFVIASPDARAELDRKDFRGLDVWHDRWWAEATASGMLAVESHSWDHNHPSLDRTAQRENRRGDFRWIETQEECRAEVDQASDYIELRSGRRPRFLAFPWGQASAYLIEEYLPRRGCLLGLMAALGCAAQPVDAASNRWNLPRYVFNHDWRSGAELEKILHEG